MLTKEQVFKPELQDDELDYINDKANMKNPLSEKQGVLMDPEHEDYIPEKREELINMGYNPQNAKEEPVLPADTTFTAVILAINDGKVRDFVKGDLTKWKNPDESAINVSMEVVHNEKKHTFDNIFTYEAQDGVTKYSARSNLGKFKAKYGKLPTVGDQVKALANKDGFLRLILE